MDVTKAISAKSDQQNAEDYIAGPRTIRITDVKVHSGQDQPIHISFDGDDGRVWKPSKTAARALAAIWGADASKWVGMHCTIYCDPDVTWAGMRVGGIRISHMEGLTEPRTLMLTRTRGKKSATVIKPLEVAPPKPTATREPIIDRAEMQRQADAAKEMSPEEKKEWWGKLNDAEKAVVRELTAKSAPN